MPLLTRPCNPTFPTGLTQSPPSPSRGCLEPKATLLHSPPFGAGFLAITLFFFIAFFSNVLLAQVNLATLGITVTLGTFGILAAVLFILFLF